MRTSHSEIKPPEIKPPEIKPPKRQRPHLALRARYRDGEIAVEARDPIAIGGAVVVLVSIALMVMLVLR